MYQGFDEIKRRTEWFRDSRFGMFIHFGLYSSIGRGEWVKSNEKMSDDCYDKSFTTFSAEKFDARDIANMAKNAGMKYMVLTAKHHDGFCLFDSAFTDYKSTNTLCGRDIVGEYIEAARACGLKVGLYYSLLDWHHDHYPKYNDMHHPRRGDVKYINENVDFENYLDYMHAQVKELVTKYGKIDILWFDFSYGDMSGERWRADEMIKMVRKYQPDVIIDNRLEGSGESHGSILSDKINIYSGDFVSPEQVLPVNGIKNYCGEDVPWELCATMNNSWGYNANDTIYKSAKTIIRKLVECVAKGGNLLINVGPDGTGDISAQSKKILRDISDWMKCNEQSIIGCGASGLPKPDWGYYTKKNNVIYAHVFEEQIGPLPLIGINNGDISSVVRLADMSSVKLSDSWAIKAYGDLAFVELGEVSHYSYPLIDDIDTVYKIELK